MKIKVPGTLRSSLNKFDLLGRDETALAKAFAYVLGCERGVLASFLHRLGLPIRNTEGSFEQVDVHIERRRDEGRTDIEIRVPSRLHVIVECKVRSGRVWAQRTQYISALDKVPLRAICFISQERDQNLERIAGVRTVSLGWLDVLDICEKRKFAESALVQEFARFATKGFKMRMQKEVLIQDVAKEEEVRRYMQCGVYRREPTFGTPLYFAPYFTRKTLAISGLELQEGITRLSKVFGVLTMKGAEATSYRDELHAFAEGDKLLVARWLKGVDMNSKEEATYYFLGNPVTLPRPLLKDGGIQKGRGKDWIAAKIPKNRCVTFEKFSEQMVKSFAAIG